ncbi:MAG: hypothetical protein DLM57_09695 [Pseudonocardiales bacterium]|nr:MAG: hypothetical protein DLM57_09695 [Pseudonocardiales bacterium]
MIVSRGGIEGAGGAIVTQQFYGPAPATGSRGAGLPARRGSVPMRPLGLSDILDGSFRVIRRNPAAVFGPSVVLAVVRVAATAGLQLGAYRVLTAVQLQLVSIFLISAVIGTVLTGVLTLVVTQEVLGGRVTARQAALGVLGRIWALVGLALVIAVLETLALVPLLVLGIWLWGLWAVAVPAMVVERTSIRGALTRSRRLVAGLWWRVWGIRALGALLAGLLGLIVTIPFLLLASLAGSSSFLPAPGSGTPLVYLLIISAGSVVSATLTAPIRAGIDALLYVDLRMRREGLDIVLQQAALPAQPVAVPDRARSAF